MERLFLQSLALVLGACVGSFLNVVAYRLPAKQSLLHPPSRCPHCHHTLSPRDNIPIVGWFLLQGRCRYCRAPISPRYPLVEATTAILFWLVAVVFGGTQPVGILLAHGLFLSWLLALSLIDIDTMTLPNRLTQSGLLLGFGSQALAIALTPPGGMAWTGRLLTAVGGAVLGLWLLDILRLTGRLWLQKEAMGAGDAKLAAAIGAWLGWQSLLLAVFLAAVLGCVGGAIAIALRRLGVGQAFPFGPYLAIGAAIALFLGDKLSAAYLYWFGLT